MKNRSLGWPSSANRNWGFANAVNNWINLVDAVTLRFWRCGALLDSAMIMAGYNELNAPLVVATME
jgi:hypothetical protein